MQKFKKENAITLVALVMTIILMLILMTITVGTVLRGDLFSKAQDSVTKAEQTEDIEHISSAIMEYETEKETTAADLSLAEFLGTKEWCQSAVLDDEDNTITVTMIRKEARYLIDEEKNIRILHNHDWVETAHVEPTCGAPGYIEYTCTKCGETKREPIAPTGNHNFVDNICTVCGYELGWEVPEGGTYESHYGTLGDPRIYTAGQKVPYPIASGDKFFLGDYKYQYYGLDGLLVFINEDVTDKNQTTYGDVYDGDINGIYITSLYHETGGNGTFKGCESLTVIPELPDTITNMANAFSGCKALTQVTSLPPNVENLNGTFSGCILLQSVCDIPDSVTKMDSTFLNCKALITVPTLSDSVTSLVSTFSGCKALTTAPIIPSSVKNLSKTFYNCTSLITYVGNSDGNGNFSHYVIPNGVTNMTGTFGGNTSGSSTLGTPIVIAPNIPNSVTNMSETFVKCTSLVSASAIPSSITTLPSTFEGCTSLLNPPNLSGATSLQSLTKTFKDCTSIVDAPSIPQSVTSMKSTFSGCTSLANAPTIPSGVLNMQKTFCRCTSLTTAPVLPSSVSDVTYTFYNCTSLVTYVGNTDGNGNFSHYVIPSCITKLNYTFGGSSTDNKLNGCPIVIPPAIPSGVTEMSNTFVKCTSLTTAPILPTSVENLTNTFYNCTSLVTYVGNTDGNGNFSNYVIPNGVSSFGSTFSGCTSLVNAPSIPSSVLSMSSAFYRCTALVSAPTIPSGVKYMQSAFNGCTSLRGEITINATPSSYGNCFANCGKDSAHTITLKGSSTVLNELAATGGTYVVVGQ